GASPELAVWQQLGQGLAQWLTTRRLPLVGALPSFTLDDVRTVADRLVRANELLVSGRDLGLVPRSLTQVPPRLPVPFLRVLAELSPADARTLDPMILQPDPTHPVARRHRVRMTRQPAPPHRVARRTRYTAAVIEGTVDRRGILPLIDEAPMYAKPHLSVWGEPFAAYRPEEGMGARHQGIAASLM